MNETPTLKTGKPNFIGGHTISGIKNIPNTSIRGIVIGVGEKVYDEVYHVTIQKIKEIAREYQIGETFEGSVSRIFGFGAMVEIAPGVEGLVHVSELAPFRVERVEDVVEVGDRVPVKIVGIDELGRINLSIKELKELKPKAGAWPKTKRNFR